MEIHCSSDYKNVIWFIKIERIENCIQCQDYLLITPHRYTSINILIYSPLYARILDFLLRASVCICITLMYTYLKYIHSYKIFNLLWTSFSVKFLSIYIIPFFLTNELIYFWLHWVFITVLGAFSGCSEQGLLSKLQCTGFSLQWLLLFQNTGSRARGRQ